MKTAKECLIYIHANNILKQRAATASASATLQKHYKLNIPKKADSIQLQQLGECIILSLISIFNAHKMKRQWKLDNA